MELIATGVTVKHGLRATIIASLVTAPATGLRRMPGVNLDDTDTSCLCLVLDTGVQVRERPTMQASLVLSLLTVWFASSHLGTLSNVLEIFQDDGSTRGRVLNDALGEDMVMVFASPKLFAAQLLEMSLGRAAAFGLQFAFQAEGASFLFLPSSLPKKLAIGGHSRSIEAEINSNRLLRWLYSGFRNGYHDMEGEVALAVAQISTTHFVSDVLHQVSRNREGQCNASAYAGKATGERIPLDPVRTLVIADTGKGTLRATNRLERRNRLALLLGFLNLLGIRLFLLGFPRERTLDGFGRLDTGGTHQLSRKIGVRCAKGIVRAFVQLHAIATGSGKPFFRHDIEAGRMLLKGCLECACLFWRGVQLYDHRSIHTKSISYILTFVKWRRLPRLPLCPSPKKGRLSPPLLERQGFPKVAVL